MITELHCVKGPVLDQLLENVSELRIDQKRVVDALVSLAQHQERIVALADKTADNKKDIDTLFGLVRESEAEMIDNFKILDGRFTTHLVNHPSPELCKIGKASSLPIVDSNFNKIQVAVILAMIYFMASQAWSLIDSAIKAMKNLSGQSL